MTHDDWRGTRRTYRGRPGLLAYQRGVVIRRAGKEGVMLVDEEERLIYSRACRVCESFIQRTTVHFPCHVARLGLQFGLKNRYHSPNSK